MSRAVRVILQGIESYLQELVGASVKALLEALGVDTCEIPLESDLSLDSGSDQVQGAGEKSLPEPDDSKTKRPVQGKIRIAQAIESYLKDVDPPQREQKTYDEYRLVLYKFRDNCGKNFIQDINRDDCDPADPGRAIHRRSDLQVQQRPAVLTPVVGWFCRPDVLRTLAGT
jgi:hypothetical protein